MRIFMRPRPDQPLARHGETGEETGDRVRIAIGPAADRVYRTDDLREILAYRGVLPERIASLMPQPVVDQERHVFKPLKPHRAPALANQRLVGRSRHVGEHRRRPAEIGIEQRAAHEMDVVGVAVVGGAQRDDRLERGRTSCRHLQPVETAPGNSHHADRAVAPALCREPGDHLEAVVLLLLQILILEQPVGLAAAAHVDAHSGIAVPGEIRVGEGVALGRAVALAVGQEFEDRGDRPRLGILGKEDPRRQPRAVGEGDEEILDLADTAGKLADDHACSFNGYSCRRWSPRARSRVNSQSTQCW